MPDREHLTLQVTGLTAGYHGSTVLHAVDLDVPAGTVHALLGANGAGKTTLLHTVMGIGPARRTGGRIRLDAADRTRDVTTWAAHRRARAGMALVPQGRRVFPTLTVVEHLTLPPGPTTIARAGRCGADREHVWHVERLLTVFPQLGKRLTTQGRHLSGGEQQMLAITRALLTQPRLLLLDEPTEGLAPPLVQRVGQVVTELATDGVAVLLATPDVRLTLDLADHVTVLTTGRIAARFDGAGLRTDPTPLLAVLAPTPTAAGQPTPAAPAAGVRTGPPDAAPTHDLVPCPPDRKGRHR
jgi:branched-chain amino acid transport system ATP-binding protein